MAGLDVAPEAVTTGVADVTGRVLTEVTVDPNGASNPVELVRNAVSTACRAARVEAGQLRAFVIGTGGMVDPRTGDVRLSVKMPDWHEGVLDALRGDLRRPVTIENDVNLAAMAEHAQGAARGVDDFVLCLDGDGPRPGHDSGRPAAPGSPRCRWRDRLPSRPVGAVARGPDPPGAGRVPLPGRRPRGPAAGGTVRVPGSGGGRGGRGRGGRAAGRHPEGTGFLAELGRRVAVGVAAIAVTLDPQLVVLGGEVGQAGGEALARRVSAEVSRICPVTPDIVPTAGADAPVLRGALLAAVDQARADLLASVADS